MSVWILSVFWFGGPLGSIVAIFDMPSDCYAVIEAIDRAAQPNLFTAYECEHMTAYPPSYALEATPNREERDEAN